MLRLPMKKMFLFLALCLLTLSAQAQDRWDYSVEVVAGVGMGHGPLAVVTPQFVAGYDLGNGFKVGAGAGIRLAKPCLQYITRNGTLDRTFCNEMDLPVFLRLGYGKQRFYAHIDAGYAVGVLSFYGAAGYSVGKMETVYKGFFVDPHVGMKLGRRGALALGVLFQQSVVDDQVLTLSGNSTSQTSIRRNLLTPAINLRYAFLF